jgi:hypothetical protein
LAPYVTTSPQPVPITRSGKHARKIGVRNTDLVRTPCCARWNEIVAHRSFEARVSFIDTAAVIDLGPRLRVVFATAFVLTQAILIATASRRPERAFGFQMFSESSTIRYSLARAMAGGLTVPVPNGEWSARGADGWPHKIAWRDRVREPALATFDTVMHASYGADAQLARLQAALDDVATHTPEDVETERLTLEVSVRKNGKEPYVVHLSSAPRR